MLFDFHKHLWNIGFVLTAVGIEHCYLNTSFKPEGDEAIETDGVTHRPLLEQSH